MVCVYFVFCVLFYFFGVIIIVIFIGVATFCSFESGTSYFDGVWWVVVMFMMVGYGDILLMNDFFKIFVVCYVFIVVGVMGWVVS